MYVTSYPVYYFPFIRILIRFQYTEWNSSYFASSHPVRRPLLSSTPLSSYCTSDIYWQKVCLVICSVQCLISILGFVCFLLGLSFSPQNASGIILVNQQGLSWPIWGWFICLASKVTGIFSNTILPSSYAGQLKLMAAAYVVVVISVASLANNS